MKGFLIFTIVLFFLAHNVSSQTFNEHFGVFEFNWADIARNVEFFNDSIYIIFTDQNPTGGRRLCTSNVSLEGELVWSKSLERDFTIRGGE